MKKRILTMGLSCVMLAAILSGCGGKTDSTTETPKETETAEETKESDETKPEETQEAKKVKIGINLALADNEFFRMVEYGLKKDFDDRGWEYMITYGQTEKITENSNMFLAQGVDAIVEFGCDQNYGNPVVQAADEKGVPVVAIDVAYDGAYFFGANNVQAGTILGEAMAEWIKENWDGQLDAIFMETNAVNGEAVANRVEKAAVALEEKLGYGEDIVFRMEAANGDALKQGFLDFLSAHPDYEHIAYVSGSLANVPPLVGAVETVGKTDIVCIGSHSEETWVFDHFNTTSEEADCFVGCVAYAPSDYGKYVGKMLQTLFDGETLPEETLMEHYVITRDNYKEIEAQFNEITSKIK